MTILVTGAAGFIGSTLCERLIGDGNEVVGVDNFDRFYSPEAKRRNLSELLPNPAFTLIEADIRDSQAIEGVLGTARLARIDTVVHLAAKAGVRPSIQDPALYSSVNVDGTVAILELARRWKVRGFVFGSSSSVYGNSLEPRFSETDSADNPISPYAATKRAGELMCHTYHHLFGLSVMCLRFFTVYGPRQRPDLAIHKFASLMLDGQPIPLFGDGSTERDYTYIQDIVDGIVSAVHHVSTGKPAFDVLNLGGNRTVSLGRLVEVLADALQLTPQIEWLPPQPGDVLRTSANIERASERLGYAPKTPIEHGIGTFVEWIRSERSVLDRALV